jgi:hypothetical protein
LDGSNSQFKRPDERLPSDLRGQLGINRNALRDNGTPFAIRKTWRNQSNRAGVD